ncbi:MAG: hypothetical protein M1830_009108 [Pleopsidium flavum]|nr:MAG: hypothetical protein M1830_009108 [Pleopsidium flavum]
MTFFGEPNKGVQEDPMAFNPLTCACGLSLGTTYSPPSPAIHSPDTTSPIYPDRPIRPLPKRRIRSRLSPDVADSILYPPEPAVTKPLFYLPYSTETYGNGARSNGVLNNEGQFAGGHFCNHGHDHSHHNQCEEVDSEDEGDGTGPTCQYQRQQGVDVPNTSPSLYRDGIRRQKGLGPSPSFDKPAAPQSTSSSADGYDSFENTNNKKKRKIPTSGNMGNHHSSLSADMANMGISSSREPNAASPDEFVGSVGQYYGSGNSATSIGASGTGLSGAGRGRYGRNTGRNVSGRSPLGVSTNGSNAWMWGRSGAARRDWTPPGALVNKAQQPPNQGIISTAIANAAAVPTTSPKGQENVSLLEQKSSKKSTPTKTQFTFTCESDSAKSMVWPGQNPTPVGYRQGSGPNMGASTSGQGQRGFATQGTQTSPSMAGQSTQHTPNGVQQPQPSGSGQQAPSQGKKTRPGRTGKEYALAARQRRLQQEYNNYHHPPSGDEIWICEFCEYESIFGSPPEALMKQYEIKDRRERRRLAEKRRLLEKAKMKGRKGKKGNKNAAKNATAATHQQQAAHQPRYDQQPIDPVPMQHQATQSEEYLAEDYDDDPVPCEVLPPQGLTKTFMPMRDSRHSAGVNGAAKGATADVPGRVA